MRMHSKNRLWRVDLLVVGLVTLLCAESCQKELRHEPVVERPVVQKQSDQRIVVECPNSVPLQVTQAIGEMPREIRKVTKKRTPKLVVVKEMRVEGVLEKIPEVSNELAVSADSVVLRAEVLQQDTVVRPVEAEVLLMKAVGRFDRKIENRLLVKKRSWMGGLTFSWAEYNSEDTQFLSLIKDFNCKANMLSINPFMGYFYKDNTCLGVKLGFERVSASLGGLNIDIDDDMSFGLSDMAFKQEMLRMTLFHRSYVGLDKSHRFGLFNETILSFNTGTSSYERPITENLKNTSTRIREIQIGLNPGATVFIMENVAAELSFGIAGFKYRQENQTVNGEESGWRKSSGANFKINLLNINIGVVAYL